jgi:hypothetical protein
MIIGREKEMIKKGPVCAFVFVRGRFWCGVGLLTLPSQYPALLQFSIS